MDIVDWIIVFLVVVALSGLLALFKYSPDPWLRTLHEYQSVVGSLVTLFAAGIALLGVWLTVSAQTKNTDRQLTEQREQFRDELRARRAAEDRGRTIRRRQIASAFIGEIGVITARFRTPEWRDTAIIALDIAKRVQGTGVPEALTMNAPTVDYAMFFRSNSAEVGEFQQPLPEQLLLFYGYYTVLEENLKFLADAYLENFKHTDVATVRRLLENQVTTLDSLETTGATLIPELQKIVNEPVQ
jgi:hypothetical protein